MRYIYVITSRDGSLKVGVAYSPSNRLKSLQTGSPIPLRLFDKVLVQDDSAAFAIEAEVHRRLKPFALEGEWFFVSPENAMATITAVISGGPPKERDKDIVDSLVFRREMKRLAGFMLVCPHCSHSAKTQLSKADVWRRRFRCSGCDRSIEGRRFFIRRVA